MNRNESRNQILFFGQCSKFKNVKENQVISLDLTIDKINHHDYKDLIVPLHLPAINPHLVYTSYHHIAIIDTHQEVWLISQPFQTPVNISKLARIKANRLTLGLKQMVIHTTDDIILVNWGSKKFINKEQLKPIQIVQNKRTDIFLFEIFSINHTDNQENEYYYNYETYNKLYKIGLKEITGYPSMDKISIKKKIKGMSACKFHCLCWDNQGKLYSWGFSSLALGYGQLPQTQLIQNPQEVKLAKFVLTAVATNHYSLALVGEGKLYEWGIKKQVNEINEEPIFHPRLLQYKYFNCKAKFVSLKGKQGNFAALASNNNLYVWGVSARTFLNPQNCLPAVWTGDYLYQPVLHSDLADRQIVDYSIQIEHLCVVVGKRQLMHDNEIQYWNLLKDNTKQQIENCKILSKIKQSYIYPSSEIKNLNFKFIHKKNKTESNLDLHFLRKKYKNNPIIQFQAFNQPKQIFAQSRQITQIKTQQNQNFLSNRFSQTRNKPYGPLKFKITKSKINTPTSSIQTHKKQKSENLQQAIGSESQSPKLRKIKQNKITVQKQKSQKHFSVLYKLRVKEMLQKKKKICDEIILQNIKRIDENTLQNKIQKKKQQLCLKKVQWKQSLLKRSILAFIIKNYMIKLLASPLQTARNIKIQNFSKYLMAQRVERNIYRLFQSAKIKFSLQHLKHQNLRRFFILQKYVKKYVVRFRLRKKDRSRALIVNSIVKQTLNLKIKIGLSFIYQKLYPLSKMVQWYSNYNQVRKKILKQLWNNFILSTFKVRDGIQFYFGNVNPNMNFHQLYAQQRHKNIFLLLSHFIKTSRKHSSLKKSERSEPRIKRKGYLRSIDQVKQKSSISQILPYSLHSTYLKRPRNLQIHLFEGIRVSQGWAAIQKQLVDQTINDIIMKFQKESYINTKKYEINLAHFIKQKYEPFNEKRWVYILQYNKVIKTVYKERQQKQLKRLLKLIYHQHLYQQDCLPQKYKVLEQALIHPNAPKPPDPYITFDLTRFSQEFLKGYWEKLNLKAKKLQQKML